jgi:hypothetical protein
MRTNALLQLPPPSFLPLNLHILARTPDAYGRSRTTTNLLASAITASQSHSPKLAGLERGVELTITIILGDGLRKQRGLDC